MVTINGTTSIFGTIICVGILITPVVIAAILGTRSRLKFAKQIRQNQADGLYSDWNKPPISKHLRILLLLELTCILGMLTWFITGFGNPSTMFTPARIAVIILLIITVIIGGAILQRMVARGK